MGEEPDNQHLRRALRLKPGADPCAGEGAIDVFHELGFLLTPSKWSAARRERRAPGCWRKPGGFIGTIVMAHPGDRPPLAPRLLHAATDRLQRLGVVGDWTLPLRRELILGVNDDQCPHVIAPIPVGD